MLHCELFPLLMGWIERSLIRRSCIHDFDDAFYLMYRISRMGVTKSPLDSEVEMVLAGAAAVTAGNHVFAEYAQKFNEKRGDGTCVVLLVF